ncbi:MAG TPA: sialidase family protein [Acidimicrobiales bacterium]|nr:sialidase family protein [Acidimicrobiales bacterium]
MRSRLTATMAAIGVVVGTVLLGGLASAGNPSAAAVPAAPAAHPADTTTTCTGVLVARLDGSISVLAPKGETCASSIAQGSLAGAKLNGPIIGSAALPNGNGYWLLGSDGGVFAFGQAQFYGSTGSLHLNAPILGMASTPDGGGYWLVGSDGGIFSYGDARFYGSTGGMKLNKPVVGMAADGATGGYWLVASDGGVFAFNAPFFGSMGGQPLNAPMRFMTGTPDFGGYRLVAIDGGVFDYGDAPFFGSAAGPGSTGWSALATTPDNGGYWLFAATGLSALPTYQAFGDAANNLTFVGGDAFSIALVVGAATVSFPVTIPSPPPSPSVGGHFNAVSCATTTVCVAVGGTSSGSALIERSTDGGSSFALDTVPTNAREMFGVDCNSSVHCVTVGAANASSGTGALVSDDGGVTWSLTTTPANTLQSVACENDADCAAVGGGPGQSGAVFSTNGGTTWSNSVVAPAPAVNVDCNASMCVAAGENQSISTDGGAHWTSKLTGNLPLFSTSCTTDGVNCLAVGPSSHDDPTEQGQLARSTDSGSTWSNASANLPATASGTFQAISCWNTTQCMTVGPDATNGLVSILGSVTSNAGATFGTVFHPTNSVSLLLDASVPVLGFTCTGNGTCIVAASNSAGALAYTSSDSGQTWTASSIQ